MIEHPFLSESGRLRNLQPLASLLVHLEDSTMEREQEQLRKKANDEYQFLYWQ